MFQVYKKCLSVVQLVTIVVKNILKDISTLGKTLISLFYAIVL